jgi:hypothetical protein
MLNDDSYLKICVISLCVVLLTVADADEGKFPFVYQDDFENGAENWEPSDLQAWKIEKTEAGNVYSQFKKRSNYEPPHRSPYNMSLLQDVLVGDFEINVDVLSTHPDYGHRDVCLFFGYQNSAQFYYVHLGKKTDNQANQVFIVNKADRTKISVETSPGTNWDDKWHHVRIARRVEEGTIEVFFDDMKKPVMVAKDKAFAWGRVGLGSFDDTSQWDNFALHGVKVDMP